MKLSKLQQEVIDLMKNGWHYGHSVSIWDCSDWLQKGELGHGGETKRINKNTFRSLLSRKLIKSKGYGYPTQEYILVENNK